MIICASRRTDVPAFHAEWMMNRLRAGYVLVRNPVANNVVYKLDLTRKNIDCIVFISKDPRPIIPYLKEIGSMGYMYTFQITMTPYGRELEPGVPFKADIADAFKKISDKIGRDRMVWRYDPVIFNDRMGLEYHRKKFELLCKELEGYTNRCTFSFLDMYGKFGRFTDSGILRGVTNDEKDAMAQMMSSMASKCGMTLSYCCADRDLRRFGIEPRGCIDRETMRALNIPFEDMSMPLRAGCRCVKNVDIGAYNTCSHNCVYCYANSSNPEVRIERIYDPQSEMLWGSVDKDDKIVELSTRNVSKIDDF
ncbi:MAG: DUF1848 domain-containing protein [Candidatus Methanogranum gryphiswaldense]|nr:MAG: DUF1848 domain-containing protein [Candidatus Methanogranum sp. U3.2.1]